MPRTATAVAPTRTVPAPVVAPTSATPDGRTSPWQPLARDVDGCKSAADAIRAAGLDWTTRTEAIQTRSGIPITGRRNRAVIRNDNNTVLGVVGSRHQLIDNRTCFDFLDAVSGVPGGLRYHAAGMVGNGERVWLLAKTDNIITVAGRDALQPYLLLHNAHDGSASLQSLFTTIRFACTNTLTRALRESRESGGAGDEVRIRHSGDVAGKVADARAILGISAAYFDDLGQRFGAMARHRLSDAQRAAYFKSVFHPRSDDAEVTSAKWPGTLGTLERLAEAGAGQAEFPEIRGTLWAALNAVTEFVDYHSTSQTAGRTEAERASARFDQVIFGPKARRKADALTIASELLN